MTVVTLAFTSSGLAVATCSINVTPLAVYTDLNTSPVNSRIQRFPDAAYLVVPGTASGPPTYTKIATTDPSTLLPVGSYVIVTAVSPSVQMAAHIPKDLVTPDGWKNTDPSNYTVTTGITSMATLVSFLSQWKTAYDT